jgi:hypothetical protein
MSVTLESRPLKAYLPLLGDPDSMTFPTRTHDDAEEVGGGLDAEKKRGSEKRRKLNFLKCKRCREARKKVIGRHMLHGHLH